MCEPRGVSSREVEVADTAEATRRSRTELSRCAVVIHYYLFVPNYCYKRESHLIKKSIVIVKVSIEIMGDIKMKCSYNYRQDVKTLMDVTC